MYLLGSIPSMDGWVSNVDYKIQDQEIQDLKTVEISQEDIDLAKLQKRSITKLKQERLKEEKKRLKFELNEKFGIKNKEEIPDRPEGLPKMPKDSPEFRQQQLWDFLNGKGLIKK